MCHDSPQRGMGRATMTRIGFILLTHSDAEQVLALCRILSDLYGDPPIVCHHDFSQCALDLKRFPSNVRFVTPHLPTFWGCFSIVPATLAAIRLLMEGDRAPDWFYLLSGSDYPCAEPARVVHFLDQSSCDVFIDHREINWTNAHQNSKSTSATGFNRASYPALAYRRYCAVAVPRPSRQEPWRLPPVGRSHLSHPAWRAVFPSPFSNSFRCYAGEHWFTANRKAAQVLLTVTAQSARLLSHLRTRESPEECFYHSIFGNAEMSLNSDNLRFIDWPSPDAWHPSILGLEHLEQIQRSTAHFARKVAHGSPLAAELDHLAGIRRAVLS